MCMSKNAFKAVTCSHRYAAKGGRQRAKGKKATKSERKVTKKRPKKNKRLPKIDRTKESEWLAPFAYPFCLPLLQHVEATCGNGLCQGQPKQPQP